tara:strand:+ start:10041 stop:10493 length:453 start_codon:yes stop_codon:yes gene_type:complete
MKDPDPAPKTHVNKHEGSAAELMVACELVRRGFSVSWPFNDMDGYDLIADSGESIKRIQVKSSSAITARGTYRILMAHGHKVKSKYTKEHCDIIISVLFYPESPAFYIIPITEVKQLHLTFFPTGAHPRYPNKWRTCKMEPFRDRWDLVR